MREVMSPALAVQFSWSGQRRPNYEPKEKFKNKKMCTVIKGKKIKLKYYNYKKGPTKRGSAPLQKKIF